MPEISPVYDAALAEYNQLVAKGVDGTVGAFEFISAVDGEPRLYMAKLDRWWNPVTGDVRVTIGKVEQCVEAGK